MDPIDNSSSDVEEGSLTTYCTSLSSDLADDDASILFCRQILHDYHSSPLQHTTSVDVVVVPNTPEEVWGKKTSTLKLDLLSNAICRRYFFRPSTITESAIVGGTPSIFDDLLLHKEKLSDCDDLLRCFFARVFPNEGS
ncbi:hypothetical protein M5689_010485 [Euphorbia peplus]|nr:hypothetical protein M5689_010485 [Euphorbia peplus]